MMTTVTTSPRRPYAARVPIDVRREQLLDAALEVIHRDGHQAVSIDAIAREAGVTRPVVYGAYDGLGPLLTALLDREQIKAFASLLAALPDEPDLSDPVGFVSDAIRRLVEMVREDPATWRTIVMPPDGMPEVVRARIDADRDRVVGVFAALASEFLTARGEVAVDGEVLGHAVLGIVEHFGRLLLTDPDRFDAERLVSAAQSVLVVLFPGRDA
jgi:AcrR family transcriptional regulator